MGKSRFYKEGVGERKGFEGAKVNYMALEKLLTIAIINTYSRGKFKVLYYKFVVIFGA